jgi:hypothetical protein
MKAEEFYKIFQEKYEIIKAFEMERYKMEEDLFLINKIKNPKTLSPLITFTLKTFPWPNPKYETNDKISYSNTIIAMDQYIIDVQELLYNHKIKN